ncbi:CotH kinase family protein [Bacteroidota bacterium]
MKKLITLCIFGFVTFNLTSQIPISFYLNNGNYKYLIGNSEPPSTWRDLNFDDSDWITGYHRIGYGDGDDSTIIDQCTSLYIRIEFTVSDTDYCKEANFMADYDDAFVAYLNGHELIRSNIGTEGEIPPFDQLADRSHEAVDYRPLRSEVKGYYIDSIFLDSNLRIGKNIISVQLHNDSINGSDLSFNSSFFNLTNIYEFNFYSGQYRYKRKINLDSSKHPILIINTDEYGLEVERERNFVKMAIIDNGEGKINRVSDFYNDYYGFANIRVRGQSSRDFIKRSYNFETQDASGNNNNVSLMGLPVENDWVLFGPFADKSQIRNELMFTLGRKLGHYEPRTRFCEVIINNEYVGLFALTEEIKIDENRVNITRLTPADNTGINVTGGYIYRFDKRGSYVDPDGGNITDDQMNYIKNFIGDIPERINNAGFLDPDTGYTVYIDTSSLIDYIILNELSKNADAYLFSTYLHKDRDDIDGRLKYGPLWDYDLGFGNATFHDGHLTEGWQFEINTRLYITYMLRDPELVKNLTYKWHKLRNGMLHTDSLYYLIDSITNYINDARLRNYKTYPIIQYDLFSPGYSVSSYEEEIATMKQWILARTEWIDNNINDIFYSITDYNIEEPEEPSDRIDENYLYQDIMVYPNPFNLTLKVYLNLHEFADIQIRVYDLLGKELESSDKTRYSAGKHIIPVSFEDSEMKKGIYIINILKDGNLIYLQKIVKF